MWHFQWSPQWNFLFWWNKIALVIVFQKQVRSLQLLKQKLTFTKLVWPLHGNCEGQVINFLCHPKQTPRRGHILFWPLWWKAGQTRAWQAGSLWWARPLTDATDKYLHTVLGQKERHVSKGGTGMGDKWRNVHSRDWVRYHCSNTTIEGGEWSSVHTHAELCKVLHQTSLEFKGEEI